MKDSPVRLLVESNVPHVRTSRFNCRDTTKNQKTTMKVTATGILYFHTCSLVHLVRTKAEKSMAWQLQLRFGKHCGYSK